MIWILTDVVVAFTMPVVWLSAAGDGTIQGFSGPDFVAYYILALLLTSFVTCHFMWDINYEIREGVLSTQIIRPVNWLEFNFLRNASYRVLRTILFSPWLIIFYVVYGSQLSKSPFQFGWQFWIVVLLGHVLSFASVMALTCIALFTEEATSIFEVYYFPLIFLSGQLFPISVLPQWAQNLSGILPFYYTVGAPTEIAMGRVADSQIPFVIGMQILWTLISLVIFRFAWRAGLKRYTGVGM